MMGCPAEGERPLLLPVLQHQTSGQLPKTHEGEKVVLYPDGRFRFSGAPVTRRKYQPEEKKATFP